MLFVAAKVAVHYTIVFVNYTCSFLMMRNNSSSTKPIAAAGLIFKERKEKKKTFTY